MKADFYLYKCKRVLIRWVKSCSSLQRERAALCDSCPGSLGLRPDFYQVLNYSQSETAGLVPCLAFGFIRESLGSC